MTRLPCLLSPGRALLRQILSHHITVRVLALMGTCGTYDFAGQWLHDVGIPARSGVAGGVLAVIRGQLGIATSSPSLDGFGNSVRGLQILAPHRNDVRIIHVQVVLDIGGSEPLAGGLGGSAITLASSFPIWPT